MRRSFSGFDVSPVEYVSQALARGVRGILRKSLPIELINIGQVLATRRKEATTAVAEQFLGSANSSLARRNIRGSQLAIRCRPDTLDAATSSKEQSRGRQGDKRHQQCVFDEVLALFEYALLMAF